MQAHLAYPQMSCRLQQTCMQDFRTYTVCTRISSRDHSSSPGRAMPANTSLLLVCVCRACLPNSHDLLIVYVRGQGFQHSMLTKANTIKRACNLGRCARHPASLQVSCVMPDCLSCFMLLFKRHSAGPRIHSYTDCLHWPPCRKHRHRVQGTTYCRCSMCTSMNLAGRLCSTQSHSRVRCFSWAPHCSRWMA